MNGLVSRLIVTGFVTALLLAVFALLPCKIPKVDALKRPDNLSHSPLGPLFGGIEVVQEFVAASSGLDAIELQLATYRRRPKGMLSLRIEKLTNGRWQELARVDQRKRELDDNMYHRFEFPSALPVRRGDRLSVTLHVNGSSATALAWYFTPGWHLDGASLRIAGSPVDGTAHFQPLYRTTAPVAASGWWSRLTLFLGSTSRILLAFCALLAVVLFVHLSLWSPDVDDARRAGKP